MPSQAMPPGATAGRALAVRTDRVAAIDLGTADPASPGVEEAAPMAAEDRDR